MAERRQFCTFFLGESQLGVAIEQVQEILRFQPMTRVPLAPASVAGLMNLRGEIVPALDLRSCLGLPRWSEADTPTNVVIRTEDGPVSLLVDRIGDVVELDDASYEAAPDNVRGVARELIQGVYKLREGLLLILETQRAVAAAAAPTTHIDN